MFTAYDPTGRWLTLHQAAAAMDTTPEAVVDACRRGLLRWTTVDGMRLVEPGIVSRHS